MVDSEPRWVEKGHPRPAAKADHGKLPMHLIPPEALTAMANRLRVGAEKYSERNWETGLQYSRTYSALMRHLLAWWGGEDIDPDPAAQGSSHLEAVLTNAAFLVTYEARKRGDLDDRPRVS